MNALDDGYLMAVAGALVWTPRLLRAWLDVLGSPMRVLEWARSHDVPPSGAPALARCALERLRSLDASVARRALDDLVRCGAQLLRDTDVEYPSSLRDLNDPPPVLYVRGRIGALGHRTAAVVGSRAATAYGRSVAALIASELGGFGACIVSGLARGVDAAAHTAALRAGAPTVAVIGAGLSALYPPYHALLADDIVAAGGAVLTEFPPHAAAQPHHFPMRNRIVAALSDVTIVVEAGARSGALITARLADELGRRVFAIPGDVDRPTSAGTNALIKDGVPLVTGGADVAGLLGWDALFAPPTSDDQSMKLDPVLAHLTSTGDDVVTIASRCGIDVPELLARLTMLEIGGLVTRIPGGRFARTSQRARPRR